MSEKSKPFQQFLKDNFSPGHLHDTMADQVEGCACLLHPTKQECQIAPNPDLLCMGTPCDPFSKTRPKRWLDGSVKQHFDYNVTFKDSYNTLMTYKPRLVIMEQVDGFDLPYCSGDSESPKQRQG